MNNNYKTLELHKILESLAALCSNQASAEAVKAIEPSTDIDTVRSEIAKTSLALELTVKYASPIFYSFKDITHSVKRADSGAALSLSELLEIKRVLMQISGLCDWFDKTGEEENELSYLFESLFPNKYLYSKLEAAIIDSETLADDASPELASIRRKIRHSETKIRESLDKMIKSSSVQKYLQEAIVTIRDGRFVLPVKSEFKGQVNGFVHDTSSSGSTLFIEPAAVVEANNDIRILQGREVEEIHRIIMELSAECAAFGEQLVSGYNAAVQLNVYFSKAELAARMNAAVPEINDENRIILNKARHPLIDASTVVPINFRLGEDYNTLIITGPNTGGKTVVLKTVGLLTAMTMCGLLIPASDGSSICIYKNILVDIGDKQSIEESLSTFSSHINAITDILDIADSSSLVLLDELGSGTDPIEGAALAVSIIEALQRKGASIVTTTHYQELKMFALEKDDVENASCEFDIEHFTPTYKLVIGTPGRSNAFAISQKLGVPEEIISHAKKLVSEENKHFEQVIDRLENTRRQLEENNAVVSKEKAEAQRLRRQLQEERDKLNRQKEDELEKARLRSSEIVNRVQRESQALIDELEKLRKEKDAHDFSDRALKARQMQRGVMNKLYEEADPVSEGSNEGYELPRPLKKGDKVLMTDTGRQAILVSVPDDKGICFVQVGVMKTKVQASKLRLIEKPKVEKQKKKTSGVSTKGVESRATRKIQTELDIRGYTADEGVYEVDNFLDAAYLSGVGIVTIIHGKGTGALKNAVRASLNRHPHVKSARRGLYGEGEDGVTIVELK
ncbi:MAG: endonuclease MutS2 [Ruminococcus sp.]|nr:endonuclease MutS2 [Ruminococcus sp.]